MIKVAVTALAVLTVVAVEAAAGPSRCGTSSAVAAPPMPSCHLQVIDPILVRFDGTAHHQGLNRHALAAHIRERLRQSLPMAIDVTESNGAETEEATGEGEKRGRFVCGIWTVGDYFPIALHIDCGLQTADGDKLDEVRLLGHTRHVELKQAVRLALDQLVKKVGNRFRRRCPRLQDFSTRLDLRDTPLRSMPASVFASPSPFQLNIWTNPQ